MRPSAEVFGQIRTVLRRLFLHGGRAGRRAVEPECPPRLLRFPLGREGSLRQALGTGFGAECGWKDIEVAKHPSGQPAIVLNGNAKETANKLGINRFHLSISHERHYATAVVIAEKDS